MNKVHNPEIYLMKAWHVGLLKSLQKKEFERFQSLESDVDIFTSLTAKIYQQLQFAILG